MELHLICFLLLCNTLVIVAPNDVIDEFNDTSQLCDVDGKCDNAGTVVQTAKKISFDLSISWRVVETFGLSNFFHELERFFINKEIVDPKDIFQLEMHEDIDSTGTHKEAKTSFVISPYSQNEDDIVDRIWSMVLGSTVIDMFFPVIVINQMPEEENIFWNDVRTVVSLKLIIEYRWLLEQDLLESTNQAATFINEMFQLYRRDIYDLILTEADNGITLVEFALPPLLSFTNVMAVLEQTETFVDSCEGVCAPSSDRRKDDICNDCEYARLFGMYIYPEPQSFISRSETWTGRETRYKTVESTYKPCPDHQEICINDLSEPKCVGIGRCDKNFYRTLQLTLIAHGSIRLLDIYGLDYSKQLVKDSMVSLHEICSSSLEVNFFGQGRDRFGINLVLTPSLKRADSVEKLDEMILTKNDIEVNNLVISKVEGSYKKSYIDLNKILPTFIENECFGCDTAEVWCLLPNISLCLSKHHCIDMYYTPFKIAESTEIIKFSLLLTGDEEYYNIDDVEKYDIQHQIAEQLDTRVDIITFVDLVPIEDENYFELGLAVMSLHNNTELRNIAIALHRMTDKAILHIVTPSATLYAVPNSIMFRQFISGYPKPGQVESNTDDIGSIITCISIAAVVFAVTTIVVLNCTCSKRRRMYT